MSLLSFLHPLWKRGLTEYTDDVNSAVINSINKSLSDSESDLVNSKVESYLLKANGEWLDYWGYWFGERRKSGWSDDTYRIRIINHVKHARNTVDGLRDAIADFINTNRDNIFIYEPYRDMFIWNSSEYNTKKYFSSTYYRYAVIDIKVSASFPKEIVSIINLFRPAGVLWVLTETINSRNSDAPTVKFDIPGETITSKIENDFIMGLRSKTRLVINPAQDEYKIVDSPFYYNDKNSLFNSSKSLYMGVDKVNKRYSFIGNSLFNYTPLVTDTFNDSSYNVEQLSGKDIKSISSKDGRGKEFDFNPIKDNLINNASKYLAQTDITSYSDKYSMPTSYLKEGQTYNFAVNINSNTAYSNTTIDLMLTSKDTNTSQIKHNLSTLVKNGNQWLTTQFTIPEGFNLDTGPYLVFSGSDSKVDFNVSKPIIKNSLNTNPISWSQSMDEPSNLNYNITEVIDVKSFINDKYQTLTTATTNKDLNDLFDVKKFHFVIKNSGVPLDSSFKLKIYNFYTNLWVTYDSYTLTNSYEDVFLEIPDLIPLLNDNGVMYINLDFSKDSSSGSAVNIDYTGFSLFKSIPEHSINMGMPSQKVYTFEAKMDYGTFIVSKSQVSKAYINKSK